MTSVDRAKLIERTINEMRRMINIIQNGRGYYYYGGSTMTEQERLNYVKNRLTQLIEEFQRI